MSAPPAIIVVANTRLPSKRAQALQVVQTAAAFARAGAATTVLHARRRQVEPLPPGVDLWRWYGVADGARPELAAVPCIDWIDSVPRRLQYWPARLQERSFARNAARAVLRRDPSALVYSREVEAALPLLRRGRDRVHLEIHRVPEGRLRRAELACCLGRCAGIVAISGGVRDDLVALGADPRRIIVEHDGFEPSRFANLPSRAEARRALDLPQDAPIVVYTGGLLEWKGVEILVDAARSLPGMRFVIAGGMDADVERIRRRAAGLAHVRVEGFVAPERVALYLAAGDAGVVPNRSAPAISARYTSPLKVFESMACGLPLVASDLPSLRDALDDELAVFVAPDDPSALADGLRKLLADPARRARMAAAGRARAARHDWDGRARRILAWMARAPDAAVNPI